MLATRSAVSLCRPVQLCPGGSRVAVGRVSSNWRRFVSGEAKTVRAIPVESGGLRARLSGECADLY